MLQKKKMAEVLAHFEIDNFISAAGLDTKLICSLCFACQMNPNIKDLYIFYSIYFRCTIYFQFFISINALVSKDYCMIYQ